MDSYKDLEITTTIELDDRGFCLNCETSRPVEPREVPEIVLFMLKKMCAEHNISFKESLENSFLITDADSVAKA